ncbi:DUF2846 domain-containing protein [Aeromonas veronii]|uniref:DUF2846 domain-containing protein n=1 Tax=Aeromonas veronii TaxID=654 RepID=UPI0038E78611
MKKLVVAAAVMASLLSGCASVPMESTDRSDMAKKFILPKDGKAGIYIFRKDTIVGAALKKDVWIDGECVGETAKGIFFYNEVDGDKTHTLSTESEFSPNDLMLDTKKGNLYFVEQYLKMGAFVGGAGLKLYDKEAGMQEVSKLNLGKSGNCSGNR